jgi:hypothetical protein
MASRTMKQASFASSNVQGGGKRLASATLRLTRGLKLGAEVAQVAHRSLMDV